MILGLDLSHWNSIDWADWPDRAFVWIKATEGTHFVDWKHNQHRIAAKEAGMKVGAYHYFRVSWSGRAQAQHFFDNVQPNDLPPVIDVERRNNVGLVSKTVFAARLKECLNEVERLFGVKPVIYTSKYAWRELVGIAGWEPGYDLWVASYTSASSPSMPDPWVLVGWKVWQHTSIPLDQNRMKKDYWDKLFPPSGGDTVNIEISRQAAVELKEALNDV